MENTFAVDCTSGPVTAAYLHQPFSHCRRHHRHCHRHHRRSLHRRYTVYLHRPFARCSRHHRHPLRGCYSGHSPTAALTDHCVARCERRVLPATCYQSSRRFGFAARPSSAAAPPSSRIDYASHQCCACLMNAMLPTTTATASKSSGAAALSAPTEVTRDECCAISATLALSVELPTACSRSSRRPRFASHPTPPSPIDSTRSHCAACYDRRVLPATC